MGNNYYELYKKSCVELEQIMEQNQGSIKDAKKLRGALAAELLRQEINQYLDDNNIPVTTSPLNSFIAGSKFEYDLLLVNKDASPYLGLLYHPKDVIAIIECKAGGLFNIEQNTNSIANAVNRAKEINSAIRFGYITMTENVPVNDYNKSGKATVKHWDLTKRYLQEKIIGESVIYAVTLHKGKKLYDEGSNDEFYDFINALIE